MRRQSPGVPVILQMRMIIIQPKKFMWTRENFCVIITYPKKIFS